MKQFYIYKSGDDFQYSAQQIIEHDDKLFLIESNVTVCEDDIVHISNNHYDLKDNGFYVMAIIDRLNMCITVSYGMFSYCHSIYYYTSGCDIYLNISLHDLLNKIDISPELDVNSANEFVRYGFVRNDNTLIKQIKKVPVLKTAIFTCNKVEITDSEYVTYNNVSNSYIDALSVSLPDKSTKITIPLSGGYDSTLLSYITKDYNDTIAVTVGSEKDPYNQFVTADITAEYIGIQQEKVYSDIRWIERFPEIVNMMEGEMFDIGVFLCYFLVDRIKQLGLSKYTLVTGDGADQLLNIKFYLESLDEQPDMNRYDKRFLNAFPKHFFYYLIVKKIEWILRQNDIRYSMPFISKMFYDYAKDNTFTETKEEYKAFVKTYLPDIISDNLKKLGGLVNERYFINDVTVQRFLRILNSTRWKHIFSKEVSRNGNLRNVLYRMYVVLFDYIFINKKPSNIRLNDILDIIDYRYDSIR